MFNWFYGLIYTYHFFLSGNEKGDVEKAPEVEPEPETVDEAEEVEGEKVVAAKIVTNARTPGARCYGFITMGTVEEATKCVQNLNSTELHGKTISVEKTKYEPGGALKRSEAKNQAKARAAAASARKEGKSAETSAADKSSPSPVKAKAPVKKAPVTKKVVKPKATADKAKDSKDKHREKRSSVRDRHSGRSRSRAAPSPPLVLVHSSSLRA
ncbi:hypothetical protein MRX96_012235 [Rhipicephalus microplus]